MPDEPSAGWRTNWVKPRVPWQRQAVLPAELAEALCRFMLARENLVEDVNYTKIACNDYLVELSPQNFRVNYQPLARSLLQQWRDRLVECLLTANSRQGRREYRFGGQLKIELRAAPDLADHLARVLCRMDAALPVGEAAVTPQVGKLATAAAFVEWMDGRRRWPLQAGDNTIGRDQACSIHLDLAQIQEKPLVSGLHATIRADAGYCVLFDGRPAGRPSANGTFLNGRRIPAHGVPLQDGDLIILAALDPNQPRPDTPGVAALRFRQPLSADPAERR
jgi:hypothetical protein